MEQPLVSVIVPVYNGEKYVGRCVDSILNQEYKNIELILVNDGSKDRTAEICTQYAERDSRVRVIDKENTGVSDSRNCALGRAAGKYIQFLDCDDWMTKDSTRLLVECAEEMECDMVVADFYRVVGERLSRKGDIRENKIMDRQTYVWYMSGNPADYYYGVLWNKLYRRDIIEEHRIRMDTNIQFCEDFLFNMEYIRYAKRFRALQAPIYYYVKTQGSLVSQSMHINKIIKMKLSMFTYYYNFYKGVYEGKEEDYLDKAQVYKFLIAAASDDMVVPMFPGTKKLGKEKVGAYETAFREEGILEEHYCQKKILEQYCQSVAAQFELSIEEVWILFYLSEHNRKDLHTIEDLSDFTGLSKTNVWKTITNLVLKKYIKIEADWKELDIEEIVIKEKAEQVIEKLEDILKHYDEVRFRGFTEEEKKECKKYMERCNRNVREVLQR